MWGTNQTSRRVLAAAITAGALVLAGCTTGEPDDEITAPSFAPVSQQPSEPDAAPSTGEPSIEPTVAAAPPLPPEATEQTPEGAVAFTEWWFDTLNYATQTGDTEALRAAYEETCSSCEGFANRIDEAYSTGGSISGGRIDVLVESGGSVESGGVVLPVFTDAAEGQVLSADGEVDRTLTAERVTLVAAVIWRETRWVMGDLAQ